MKKNERLRTESIAPEIKKSGVLGENVETAIKNISGFIDLLNQWQNKTEETETHVVRRVHD